MFKAMRGSIEGCGTTSEGGWPQVWHCCSRLAVPVSYEKTPQEQLQVYVAMQLLRTFMHLPEFMIRQDALIRLL